MSDRKYMLELTAEELLACARGIGIREECVRPKVEALIAEVEADRDLRLPWRAEETTLQYAPLHGASSYISGGGTPSPRAAKLASAAPELLDAVKAARPFFVADDADGVLGLIDRALRKVETGIPEDP